MRRKHIIFVCVVAISTFLVAAADIASDEELIDNDREQEIPGTELSMKISSEKEEFVNDDGEQEITTTELPKKKAHLTCVLPPEIEGAIPPRFNGNEFKEGDHVTYSCNYGYVSRNSATHISICILNKKTGRTEWTVPEITCIPRSCGDPGNVKNGRRVGNLFTFPNKVEFECEDGYKLVGMKARYCQAGGEWSGRLPSCEPILCGAPPDLVNGDVTHSSLEYGAELTYRCYPGYMVTHKERRYCDGDGTWSGVAPECIETRCTKPIPPEYGEVHFIGEPKVGSIATYSCNPRLKLHGASTTKCLLTGQWTFGPPQCLSSCSVPRVENGEMSKLSVLQISRYRKEETYTPIFDGERVDHNAKLSFHCNEDFAIVEGDKILEDVRIDVTCYDGKWSRDLHCKQTSCLGDPPKIENGKEKVGNRRHGHSIWYKCDNKDDDKIKGNVTCHFGTWIGIPPQCLSKTPCYSTDLSFPGLEKPPKRVTTSSEGFDIACKQGYRLSTSAKTITCKRGKWNVTEDPCPSIHKDIEQSSPIIVPPLQLNGEEKSPSSPNPPNSNSHQPQEQCQCTYVSAGHHVLATVGDLRLKDGDKVGQGTKVSLSCKGTRMLTWKNGFRVLGNASMTCTSCRRWEFSDNPECKVLEPGGPFIILDHSLEIQPGGAVEVPVKKRITLTCVSTYTYPQWHFPGQPREVTYQISRQDRNVVNFISNLHINEMRYDDAGLYTCHFSNPPYNIKRTVVDVRVEALPRSPTNVRVSDVTATSVLLSWSYDIGSENIIHYVIHYKPKQANQKYSEMSGITTMLYTVRDLSPHTEYEFYVIAVDGIGRRGSPSTPVVATTGERVLPWPPTNVRIRDVTATSVLLSWSYDLVSENMIHYVIQYKPKQAKQEYTEMSGITTKLYTVRDLSPYTEYEFYVIAVDGIGQRGSRSTPVVATTAETDKTTCAVFRQMSGLKVVYSNENFPGSNASFSCTSPRVLNGYSFSVCLENGSWSHQIPLCEDECSIDLLSISVKVGVVPDMSVVTGEFVPFGSIVPLRCEGKLIPEGNSTAVCGGQSRWKIGKFECASGCRISMEQSSHLQVEPLKNSYRIGEQVTLSCPDGEKTTNDVQRLMCLGQLRWSDAIPNCIKK